MSDFLKSAGLMLVLLNPFLVILYLVDMVENMAQRPFAGVLVRAGLIAAAVFCSFAILGDAIFADLMQAEFASLIGPGTISASVVIGKRLDPWIACAAVVVAVAIFVVMIVALKSLHDFVRPRSEPLVQRYIEIAGRIMALFVGTISIEMIMQGLRAWAATF